MFQMIRSLSAVISVVCAVIVFFHVTALVYLRALSRWKRALIALPFACLTAYFMRNAFSTAWMVCFHISAVLTVSDGIYVLFRRRLRGVRRRGLAFLAAFLVCAYGLANMRAVRNTEYRVETDKLAEDLRFAVISDVHLGNSLNALDALSLIDRARDRGAELLILAGDIVDERTDPADFDLLAAGLGARRFPLGMFYVYGNHDGGASFAKNLSSALEKAGVTVLSDKSVRINGVLRVAGRQNAIRRNRLSPEALLAGADIADEFVLMIDHQPVETALCAAAGADLLVSGHTHNGQIWPINLISTLFRINEIEYGLKRVGSMNAVVSSGASGWGCSFRTAGRSEIAFINVVGTGQKSAEAHKN